MNKAVFLDRDHTIIDDPGYLSDPEAVRLLPGVEVAIKSLAQAGYKIVVVTNQSGIARGLLTEETLEKINAEMRRQLAARGAHLDAIYYCPYHVEGTVEKYIVDSELRKPKPGMLLKAAKELDIDLSKSWMVGDSPADIEAGQRASCRTIRLRSGTEYSMREQDGENVQADFTIRNLSEAAKIILRQPPYFNQPTTPPAGNESNDSDTNQTCLEILRYVRQLARADQQDQFNFAKVIGTVAQVLALLALAGTIAAAMGQHPPENAHTWAMTAVMLQVMALTFFTLGRNR